MSRTQWVEPSSFRSREHTAPNANITAWKYIDRCPPHTRLRQPLSLAGRGRPRRACPTWTTGVSD
eukprot:3885243-Prymnesium_polylepis.1